MSVARAATSLVLLSVMAVTACAPVPPSLSGPDKTASISENSEENTPSTIEEQAPTEAETLVDAMTLDQQIRSLLLLHQPGSDAVTLSRFLNRTAVAGTILMPDNIAGTSASVRSMLDHVHGEPPHLIAIDQEGGPVARIRGDNWPAMRELSHKPVAATVSAFTARAQMLRRAGVTVNFGVVADVATSPSSYMWSRSAGPSVAVAGDRVAAAVRGENGVVYSTLKHFPGHGVSTADSHSSLPTSNISRRHWSNTHAVPFARGIEAGADLVMMGHLRLTSVSSEPASLSKRWVTILRHDMGFDGVIVTDDILMLSRSGIARYSDPVKNSVNAVIAGNDLILLVLPRDPTGVGFSITQFVDGVHDAITEARLSEEQIRESAIRVMTLRTGTP
ncbi:MAG: glycoside hydrolase family 3 N-terminal domain-containing protein [Microbacteriaceae bacterium]